MLDANSNSEITPGESSSGSRSHLQSGLSRAWNGLGSISRNISHIISIVSVLALVFMILLICYDVIVGKVFSLPFPGFLEMVSLSQLLAISFAMGITFIAGHHIKVEILLRYIPERSQAVVISLMSLISFILFVLIIWQLVVLARSFHISGQVTDTVMIPLYPFVYAVAFAFIPVCLAILYQLGNSLNRVIKR